MYNLALVNLNDGKSSFKIKPSELMTIADYKKEEITKSLEKFHGVIIEYSGLLNFDYLLELILSIEEKPIWLFGKTKNTVEKKIALELGAIGILDGNVSSEEMYLMLKNTLSLIYMKSGYKKNKVKKIRVELDYRTNSLVFNRQVTIDLTNKEYMLLVLLMKEKGKFVTYQEISNALWKNHSLSEEESGYRIANIIYKIRKKIKKADQNPAIIKTVRNIGYKIHEYSI